MMRLAVNRVGLRRPSAASVRLAAPLATWTPPCSLPPPPPMPPMPPQPSRGPWWRAHATSSLLAAAGVVAAAVAFAPAAFPRGHMEPAKEVARPALPRYTAAEVARHKTRETGVWVTFRGGVYDVTSFIDYHPGGTERLMLAAGGSLEPYWRMYQQHFTEPVLEILEEFRIGTLDSDSKPADASSAAPSPYDSDPVRHPDLHVHSLRPFNAEPPLAALHGSFFTPNELFFIRNHFAVPTVDPKTFRVQLDGLGIQAISMELHELRALFPYIEVAATLQCCGNRRREMNTATAKPTAGLPWEQGAISNAKWGGVRLRDVLLHAGLRPDNLGKVRHVVCEGLDGDDMTGTRYETSIPIDRVLHPDSDVLLAFDMNGEPIPRDHGFPLRLIVPGVTGARSVKWLRRITLSEHESSSQWQQKDYKVFPNTVTLNNVDWSKASPIFETNVQSAICEPAEGSVVSVSAAAPEIKLSGFAFSGGGRPIERVDVSADGGKTWYPASITTPPNQRQPRNKAWAWVQWTASLQPPPMVTNTSSQPIELTVRAFDASGNSQPESAEPFWNARGLSNNAWHRVRVNLRTGTA